MSATCLLQDCREEAVPPYRFVQLGLRALLVLALPFALSCGDASAANTGALSCVENTSMDVWLADGSELEASDTLTIRFDFPRAGGVYDTVGSFSRFSGDTRPISAEESRADVLMPFGETRPEGTRTLCSGPRGPGGTRVTACWSVAISNPGWLLVGIRRVSACVGTPRAYVLEASATSFDSDVPFAVDLEYLGELAVPAE